MQTLPLLTPENATCSRCQLSRKANAPVCGLGPSDARLMVVGEWPGKDEDIIGRPFQDRNGLVLRKLMTLGGVDPASAYLTYTVRCFGKAQEDHIDDCKPWLWKEMAALRPRVIVTLGKTPTGLLLKLKSFTLADYVGTFNELEYLPGVSVAPWHGLTRLGQQGRDGDKETAAFFKAVLEKTRCD